MNTADLLVAGRHWQQAGDLPRAAEAYRRLLSISPANAETWCALGSVCVQMGHLSEAVECYRRALCLGADAPDVYNNLGVAYSNLRRFDEAIGCFRQALARQANLVDTLRNLGSALREAGQVEEAISVLRETVRLKPDFAEAHASLGIALLEAGNTIGGLVSCEEALRFSPELVSAHKNRGVALFELGRRDEAEACYDRALKLAPDSPDIRKNRAILWLQRGNLAEGWREFEWRWKCAELPQRPISQPLWDGSPLEGKTILLHCEQGLGDTIQFIRYVALVERRGGRPLVVCQRELSELLRDFGRVRHVIDDGPLPSFDVHAPLMSLPRLFGTTLDNVPADVPYLFPDSERLLYWRRAMANIRELKVGIVWQGSRLHRRDRSRSVRLTQFAPLAAVPSIRLMSLQKGDGREQLASLGDRFRVHDVAGQFDDASSFLDLAAAVKCLDLVITVDTSVAHLAGALAVETWVALPSAADWRWLLNRDDSPWYPTMRLFRQTELGDWRGVFERMADRLAERVVGDRHRDNSVI